MGLWSMSMTLSMNEIPSIAVYLPCPLPTTVEPLRQSPVQNVHHQGALARTGNACHAGEQSQRDGNVNTLEVIGSGPPYDQLLLSG